MTWYEHKRTRYLVLAEKPSQLKALSAALPRNKNIALESLCGHCLGLADLAAYGLDGSWMSLIDKLPFIPKCFLRVPVESKFKNSLSAKQRIERVAVSAATADAIVLACDPDNEGMALGFEVLEHLGVANKIIGAINTSKLDAESLRSEIQDISSLRWREMAAAGMARAEYDWSLGINGTVLASVQLGQGDTLHVGGVKLPTLRCVVERERAITSHVTQYYYTVGGRARHEASGAEFDFELKVDRHTELSKRTAELVRNQLRQQPHCRVTDYAEKLGLEQAPPKPFSLADLQSEASIKLRKAPGLTLKLAQQLYEAGYVSYPRTDCRHYAEGQRSEVPHIMDNLLQQEEYQTHEFPKPFRASTAIFQNSKVSAHTALSVTSKLLTTALDQGQIAVYKLIATRYAIQFMRKFGYNSYALLCEPAELGKLKGTEIQLFSTENVATELGWKRLYNESYGVSSVQQRSIPAAKPGDPVRILNVEVTEHKTEPPARFTEASLLKAMERITNIYPELKGSLKNGIGTPATRAKIIEDLVKNRYLEHRRGATLHPTELAFKSIDTLPESLSNVARRANLEAKLQAIGSGDMSSQRFREEFTADLQQCASEISAVAQERGYKPSGKKRGYQPSSKQLSYARSLAKRLKLELPDTAVESSQAISAWISQHQQQPSDKPLFSEKQRAIVLSNCEDERIRSLLDSSERSDYTTVSKWIGEFLANKKGKSSYQKKRKAAPKVVVEFAD